MFGGEGAKHESRLVVMGLVFSGLLTIGQSFGAAGTDLTQTVSGGGVTVKVTYLGRTEHEARFSVAMDTPLSQSQCLRSEGQEHTA